MRRVSLSCSQGICEAQPEDQAVHAAQHSMGLGLLDKIVIWIANSLLYRGFLVRITRFGSQLYCCQSIDFGRPVIHKIMVLDRTFPRTYGSENFGAVDYQ